MEIAQPDQSESMETYAHLIKKSMIVSLRNSSGSRRAKSAGVISTAPGPPQAGNSAFKPCMQK